MPQVVSIRLGLPPTGVTHFNLQFAANRNTAYIPYSTTSSSPSSPTDVTVGLLDASGAYLLDGVNAPVGNAAVASASGVVYQARWKNGTGYSNWSEAFGVGEAGAFVGRVVRGAGG